MLFGAAAPGQGCDLHGCSNPDYPVRIVNDAKTRCCSNCAGSVCVNAADVCDVADEIHRCCSNSDPSASPGPATCEAVLSSSEAYGGPATNAIDGSNDTFFHSASGESNWLSVQVPANTRIGYVAIYNRRDHNSHLMGSVQLWLSSSSGAPSANAIMCGETSYDALHEPDPYMLWCGGVSDRRWVTVVRVDTGRLALAELVPYIAPPSSCLSGISQTECAHAGNKWCPLPQTDLPINSATTGGIVVGAYLGVAGAFGAFAAYRGVAY